MARKGNLTKAAETFEQAAYNAEDGAIVQAAILAHLGTEHLAKEWKRRRSLRAGTVYSTLSLAQAVNTEIARRKAVR